MLPNFFPILEISIYNSNEYKISVGKFEEIRGKWTCKKNNINQSDESKFLRR